jgi:hypothetical protein
MRTPSIKTLSDVFSNPREAKRIISMGWAELSVHPVAVARIRECYNPPKKYDVRLTVLNSIEPGLHGVEGAESTDGEWATYLNAGDTYAPTVIYWRGSYRVQSLGDFVETMERQRVHFK